jgi:hypothetical protein
MQLYYKILLISQTNVHDILLIDCN